MSRSRPYPGILQVAAVLISCAVGPAQAQTLGLAPSHDISPWRVIGALVFCCVLGGAGALALRYRLQRGRVPARATPAADWRALFSGFGARAKASEPGTQRLQLVETVRLGFNVEVNLLDCDGKSLVVITSPQGPLIANPEAPARAKEPS